MKCVILIVAFGLAICGQVLANTVVLEDNLHGLTGLTAGQVSTGPFTATIAAGPSGAVLNENDSQGLGVDNRLAAGATADSGSNRGTTKLNIIGGSGAVAGSGEFVTLSFDRPGVLQHLLFDGVKDESLEYFQLILPNSEVLTIFDSQTHAKLNDQGFDLSDLQVTNPILCQDEEDNLYDLNYRFQAGDVFMIAYGEVDFGTQLPGYVPVVDQEPNGARFQGFSVVPEPSSWAISAMLLTGVLLCRRHAYLRAMLN